MLTLGKFTGVLAIGAALSIGGFSALPAQAALDTVTIDDVILSRCGQQYIYFSGVGTYSDTTQHLVVDLDGTVLGDSHSEPSSWSTGLILVSPGAHILNARIYNTPDYGDLVAVDSMVFTVAACPTPIPAPSSGGDNGSGGGNGGGGGGDETPVVQKGKVKGATAAMCKPRTIDNRQVPVVVARVFKQVFGRTIAPKESTYWKNRARTDKCTEAKLIGAMQFHKSKGLTIGK